MSIKLNSFNINEIVNSRDESSKYLIVIAHLVERLGSKVIITVDDIERVVHRKELIIERNDHEEDTSMTIKVEGYEAPTVD